MTTHKEALHIALDALENPNDIDEYNRSKYDLAITVIKEALAQPEQEPVAWQLLFDDGHTEITTRPVANWKRLMWESAGKRWDTLPLYTTPPQRKPLTDEQIAAIVAKDRLYIANIWFARAIEAAHGIKE